MPAALAVFPSHFLAGVEYAFHVPANKKAHERKLGLLAMRAVNEPINFCACIGICLLTQQPLLPKYFLALGIVVFLCVLIVLRHVNKRLLAIAGGIVVVGCAISFLYFRSQLIQKSNLPPIVSIDNPVELPSLIALIVVFLMVSFVLVATVYAPQLMPRRRWLCTLVVELFLCTIAGCFLAVLLSNVTLNIWTLLLLILLMCYVPNSFMLVAWYSHTQIKPKHHFFVKHPILFSSLLAWSTAFLEYSFLIPLLRFAYQYLGVLQLFGLMELPTISVFLLFCYFVSKRPEETVKLTTRHVILYSLIICTEVLILLP